MRFSTKLLALFGVLALGLGACGEDVDSDTGGEVVVDSALTEHMSNPVFVLDADDAQPGLAFGFTQDRGWHWVRRSGVDFTAPQPDRSLPPNASVGAEVFEGFSGGAGQGGNQALTFQATGQGSASFSASFNAGNFSSSTPTMSSFSGETQASESFSPSLGYGSASYSCNLAVICDIAANFCGEFDECDAGAINQCYSAVYSIDLPPEVSPFICILVDFLTCLFAEVSASLNGQPGGSCNLSLAGFSFDAEFDSGPRQNFDNPDEDDDFGDFDFEFDSEF